MGDTQKKFGKYSHAIVSFKEFIRDAVSGSSIDQELINSATKEIEDCEWAEELVKNQDNYYDIAHLGDEVNTPFTEFAPIMDGQNLYFSTLRYPKDTYTKNRILSFSKVLKERGGVVSSILLDTYDVTDKHVAHTSFYEDHTKVIFTVCGYSNKGLISCELYTAQLSGKEEWSNISRLPDNINLKNTTSTQPNIVKVDGVSYLYFVSDREGGKGSLDIWRSQLDLEGIPGEPENLGSKILLWMT